MTIDSDHWAQHLLQAERQRQPVAPVTEEVSGLTLTDGYVIQDKLVRAKVEDGDRVVGAKLGLTSRAKQVAIGAYEPVYGWLTSANARSPDAALKLDELIHPRAEPEVVFLIGERLAGPGVTMHDVIHATRAVTCGLEIIDSRYVDFRFQLPDAVADNVSAARFVLGTRFLEPTSFDLSLVGCVLEQDGKVVTSAAGAAVMGHPAEAVALLANWLGSRGAALEPGYIVFSGALTAPVPLKSGSHVVASFGRLGQVSVRADG